MNLAVQQLKPLAAVSPSDRESEKIVAQERLRECYRIAKENGIYELNPPLGIAPLIQHYLGQTQRTFILPNGKQIGAMVAIGIGMNTQDHSVTKVDYDKLRHCCRLALSYSKSGEVKTSMILIHENRSGADAIETAHSLLQGDLLEAYRIARDIGAYTPEHPLEIAPLIQQSNGKAQRSFILPDGEQVGVLVGIGLGSKTSNQAITKITYDGNLELFRIHLSYTKSGQHCSRHFFVFENRTGRDAIATGSVG